MSDLNATDIFNKWLKGILAKGFDRYSYASRKSQIADLVGLLKLHNIEFSDAKRLKDKVLKELLSDDGYKSRKKHANGNWRKNTEADFDSILADEFIHSEEIRTYQVSKTFSEDPAIMAWTKKTFGDNVDIEIVKQAHTPGNVLFYKAVNEICNRNTGGRL